MKPVIERRYIEDEKLRDELLCDLIVDKINESLLFGQFGLNDEIYVLLLRSGYEVEKEIKGRLKNSGWRLKKLVGNYGTTYKVEPDFNYDGR